jgi:hypothetical protein
MPVNLVAPCRSFAANLAAYAAWSDARISSSRS